MTRPDLVIVPVGVLSLGCVLCVGLHVSSDGMLMLVCVLGVSAGCMFGVLQGGSSV